MAQFQASQPLEGLSTTRPPFFDGTNYNYWKNRMKVSMLANVPNAWIVTMKGPYVPMKVVGEREVPKEEVEWNDEDLGKIMINNKAINMLQCALNPTEFHRVFGCDTAKEMWDMLEVTHEGTSQVKESKINRLIYMYELFKMKPEESIQDMYTRLNDIVTNLKALAKKTAIEESRDLNTLKLEDLIGKLMTYEIEIQVDDGVEVVEKKKKKDVAFKASNQKEKSEEDASDGENISTLISREVRRFMKKNIKSKLAKRDEGESTKRSVKYYECNKMGHYRKECPKLKKGERKNKKSMKKKAFSATWSNDETSSTESESSLENGVANLCFMAQEESYNDEEGRIFGTSIHLPSWSTLSQHLPKSWEAKKTIIEEAKNLSTLKLDDFIGNLMTYEIDIQVNGKVEIVEKKKKNVALKASKQKEESGDDASDDESSNEEDNTKLVSK
ncbi:hypothetical protein SLEP1_g22353 [Rubroshorea leprosula]|uniref:CCHC-type domain-containing protein n=1 Tax=Rubroshorea leprosula TaxID=152421 RepID=A0AAV5JBX3_9ROSI|nr:hypothetical protein SLEP1_g22353 [Rubroshorea leprosula]